jgi:two-component system, chemotaxis family, chemotaxis protein CheY
MPSWNSKDIDALVKTTRILVVDDDHYMRKLLRSLLLSAGIKEIHEAQSGTAGLDAICAFNPDVVLLSWDMPENGGAWFMRRVRSPENFPVPHVPVVMLTSNHSRETVMQAVRAGVNEFLCKPVSAKALYERILSIRAKPRPMIRKGNYYGPEPRRMTAPPKSAVAAPEVRQV